MTQLQHLSPPTTAKESFLARFLDPVDRLVEGIYSVLIVLTFTLAFDVYQAQTSAGRSFVSAVVFQLFIAALRLSNLAAVSMLYWMGHSWGKHVGSAPWKIGLSLLLIGVVMVSVAIPLGG